MNSYSYVQLLRAESSRLSSLVYSTEHELEKDKSIPEEVRGKMRVAVGKAKMLLKKKFSLFEELCLKNVAS